MATIADQAKSLNGEIKDHVHQFLEDMPMQGGFVIDDVFDYLYEIYGGPTAEELRWVGEVQLESFIELEYGSGTFFYAPAADDLIEVDWVYDSKTRTTYYKRVN